MANTGTKKLLTISEAEGKTFKTAVQPFQDGLAIWFEDNSYLLFEIQDAYVGDEVRKVIRLSDEPIEAVEKGLDEALRGYGQQYVDEDHGNLEDTDFRLRSKMKRLLDGKE